MIFAKPIMPDKFWILEDDHGMKKGTLQANNSGINVTLEGKKISFSSFEVALNELGITEAEEAEPDVIDAANEVQGYPTMCVPYNAIWDVKKKLPLFTKTEKSKSLHAAGFYLIKFEHGWVKSFCPKLTTLSNYEYIGPFKTKIEVRERLRIANG